MKVSDEFIGILINMFEDLRNKRFEIGDMLIMLVQLHDGRKNEVLNYLAGILRVSASTLYDYYRVAENWSKEDRERYQYLDWTIYRNTNPKDPADVELIEMAIDEGWSATRLKDEKYGSKSFSELLSTIKLLVSRISEKTPDSYRKQEIIRHILSLITELETAEPKIEANAVLEMELA